MRFARRLFLLAVAAVAAMAFASPALAQTDVEIRHEVGGAHCEAVTMEDEGHGIDGGCWLHATSVGAVVLLQNEVPVTSCLNEFEARVDEFGHGYIYDQQLTEPPPPPVTCGVEPCTEDGGSLPADEQEEWEFQIDEPNGPSEEEERLTANFCISPIGAMGTKTRCELEVDVVDLDTHDYRFATAGLPGGTHCHAPVGIVSVAGAWDLEVAGAEHPDAEAIEIHHEDDEPAG
jgi:hypothetical protein